MKEKVAYVLLGIGIGYVFAQQVVKIPLVNKIPQV